MQIDQQITAPATGTMYRTHRPDESDRGPIYDMHSRELAS